MASRSIYALLLVLSTLSFSLIVFSEFVPYGQYIGVVLAISAGIIGKANNISYNTMIERKKETRILGYVLVLGGITVLGYYEGGRFTPTQVSSALIVIGSLLVAMTLEKDKWKKL